MTTRIQCCHAIDIGKPSTVECRLKLGGGRPHYGFCCGCQLCNQKDVTLAEIRNEDLRRSHPAIKISTAATVRASGCCDRADSK